MPSSIRRIAVLTGGGDAPGLNAVIRAVTKAAIFEQGWEVMGIEDGYLGLIEDRLRPLTASDVFRIVAAGGTILGTSNKVNPSKYAVPVAPGAPAGTPPVFKDMTEVCRETLRRHNIDALVAIGGDGTMAATSTIMGKGVRVVGVPKTIDNDILGTELTFGFLSAVEVAAEALERVYTTAMSHGRIIVVEVMGRNAGWIALHAGVASASEIVLIPEIPFDFDVLERFVRQRVAMGMRAVVVCVSEGAVPRGGAQTVARNDPTSPDPIRLGGVSRLIADELEKRTGIESRYTILGHVQRGGAPVPADRVLATQFGHRAVQVLAAGGDRRMVVVQQGKITDVDIGESASGKQRTVPMDHPLLAAARCVGTCFGDTISRDT